MSSERNFVQHERLQNDVDSTVSLNCAVLSRLVLNRDCFSTLPSEMLIKIFKHLNLPSLLRCGTVNTYWHSVAEDSLIYYNIADQYEYEKQITFLKTLTERRSRVRKFEYKFDRDDVFCVEFFQNCCRELTHLKLSSNIGYFNDIVPTYCCVYRYKLHYLKKLKSIEISNKFFIENSLRMVLANYPDLEYLKLDNCYTVTPLDFLLATIGKHNKKVRCLDFYPDTHIRVDLDESSLEPCVEEIPTDINLQKLKLTNKVFYKYTQLLPILYKLKKLTKLTLIYKPHMPTNSDDEPHLEQIKNETTNFCSKVFENLPNLRKLEFSANLIPESEVKQFEKLYPKLRIII